MEGTSGDRGSTRGRIRNVGRFPQHSRQATVCKSDTLIPCEYYVKERGYEKVIGDRVKDNWRASDYCGVPIIDWGKYDRNKIVTDSVCDIYLNDVNL